MSTPAIKSVRQVAHHRNGICGLPFYAVLFTPTEPGLDHELFLATVFEEPGAVSVISVTRVETDGVSFGDNSWRGDHYETELRAAIAAYNSER